MFGDEEGKGNKSADEMSDGGLDCGAVPESQTAARGFNDVYTPATPPTALTTTSTNLQNPSNTGASQNGTQLAYGNGSTMNQLSATSASVGSTAVTNTSAGQFKPLNEVKLGEPDIDWSYAVIERQSKENLTTSLLPFNLGKLVLEGDQSQNLELLPGDVVTIFSKADIRVPQAQQTRFVRLEGRVCFIRSIQCATWRDATASGSACWRRDVRGIFVWLGVYSRVDASRSAATFE